MPPTPTPTTKPTSSTELRAHADALSKRADGWRRAAERSDQNRPTPESMDLDLAKRDIAELRSKADTARMKQHDSLADHYDEQAAKLEQKIPQLEQAKANDGSPRAVLEAKARDADEAVRQYREKADSLDEDRDATAEAARLRAAGDEAGASSAEARAAGARVLADLLDPQGPVVEPRDLKAAKTGILDPPAPPPAEPEPNWPSWDKPPGNWGPRASVDDGLPGDTVIAAATHSDSTTGDEAPPAYDLALGDDILAPSPDPGAPVTTEITGEITGEITTDDVILGTTDVTTTPAVTTDELALGGDILAPSPDPGAPVTTEITTDDVEPTPFTDAVGPFDPVIAGLDTQPEPGDGGAGMSDPLAPEPVDSYAQAEPFVSDTNAGDDPFQDVDAASETSTT